MTLGQSIRTGAKWLALGKLGNRLSEFAFGVILARLLTPADFGMIATVAVFTGFVGMFTAGGMGQSLIRAKEADEEDFTAVFTLQLALGILVYLGFFIAAPFIARAFDNPIYTELVRVMALSFLLRPFHVMRTAWLNRRMDFKSRTKVEVSMGLFTGVTASLMAWAGLGVWSLALSGLLSAFVQNLWLSRLVPLRARINPNRHVMTRHTSYGAKIVANDFVSYLRKEGKSLVISKLAGPASLGLFNKAESLARLPNQLMMSPTMEPLFRALSKTQDDLAQSKYLYYRSITLLTAYTGPLYVILWWVAEPFVGVVYGQQWVAAAEPMRVLLLMGVFLNVMLPSSVVLAAQNRLGKEMLAQSINLPLVLGAVAAGLHWGLAAAAWGLLIAQALLTAHFYWYVCQTLPARRFDLLRAIGPGIGLSAMVGACLFLVDQLLQEWGDIHPAYYLVVMLSAGGAVLAGLFLYSPFRALESEAKRWKALIAGVLRHFKAAGKVST